MLNNSTNLGIDTSPSNIDDKMSTVKLAVKIEWQGCVLSTSKRLAAPPSAA